MGIQMSVAWQSMQWIPHVILCQWGKNIGICCGLYGALDTLEGRPGIIQHPQELEPADDEMNNEVPRGLVELGHIAPCAKRHYPFRFDQNQAGGIQVIT